MTNPSNPIYLTLGDSPGGFADSGAQGAFGLNAAPNLVFGETYQPPENSHLNATNATNSEVKAFMDDFK